MPAIRLILSTFNVERTLIPSYITLELSLLPSFLPQLEKKSMSSITDSMLLSSSLKGLGKESIKVLEEPMKPEEVEEEDVDVECCCCGCLRFWEPSVLYKNPYFYFLSQVELI